MFSYRNVGGKKMKLDVEFQENPQSWRTAGEELSTGFDQTVLYLY
jgi:hypothetical protein